MCEHGGARTIASLANIVGFISTYLGAFICLSEQSTRYWRLHTEVFYSHGVPNCFEKKYQIVSKFKTSANVSNRQPLQLTARVGTYMKVCQAHAKRQLWFLM